METKQGLGDGIPGRTCMLNHTKKRYLEEGGKKKGEYKHGITLPACAARLLRSYQDQLLLNTKIGQLPCAYKEINQSGNFGLYIYDDT